MVRAKKTKLWYGLLLLPYLALLYVPSYNQIEPAWLGFPFFYWYQLLWIGLSAVVVALVYKVYKT